MQGKWSVQFDQLEDADAYCAHHTCRPETGSKYSRNRSI